MLRAVDRAVADRVDWIQVREKHLDSRELAALARRVLRSAKLGGTKVLINSRVDVALACGADGVHLPADSIGVSAVRQIFPLLVGVSVHSLDEAKRAQTDGANYVLFSPVFESVSKPGYGPPAGLETLRWVCNQTAIPVLALGGVTQENSLRCVEAGAVGVAGISLFQRSPI